MTAVKQRTRPLRALHVFATFVPAGPQVRAVALMRGMGAAFSHRICAADDQLSAAELIPQEIDSATMSAPRRAGPLGSVRAWRAVLKAERPDLLLTYNWGSFDAVLAARSLGLPNHVHHEDGFNADEIPSQKKRRIWARRLALNSACNLVVPSRALRDIASADWRVPAERLHLIVNGVDLQRFRPDARGGAALRAELGIPADALVVGSVGHLRPVKRYDRLLRACALLPAELAGRSVHLVLVGDGEERAGLEALAAEQRPPGGAVHFVGHQTELAPWYAALDAFCMSSDSEQLPVALLEAMACGLPVAATDVGDIRHTLPEEARENLSDPTGADAPEQLARVLGRLLQDGELGARLGRLGRERVEQLYSEDAMVRAYRGLYLEVAGRR